MKIRPFISMTLAGGVALLGCSGLAAAQDLGGLKSMLGGGSLTSGSTGNVAGIIEYCVKNNYLGGTDASSVQNKLLGKLGGTQQAQTDSNYKAGLKGMLLGKDGKNTNLANASGDTGGMAGMSGMAGMGDMKSKLTKKACGLVLKQGKSLL
jgi:Protein of unknown function (DUF2501).